jgi:UDP-3-O-[3-hydroxymyristoyl] glucosamine N-acyltransferase
MRLKEIAEIIHGNIIGNENEEILFVTKIDAAEKGGIAFLSNSNYIKYLNETKASAVLVSKEFNQASTNLIQVENPYNAFVKVTNLFYQIPQPFKGIDPQSRIASDATIGENASIGPFVYIGKNVKIGKNVVIYPQTVIMDDVVIGDDVRLFSGVHIREQSLIGSRVCIHSGAVIGADGFGFAPNFPHGFEKIWQSGIVRIEDDVEIGANTCIDRATIGETVIEKGTKLDNLIQIAHNVRVGKNTVIAAQSGIAGSSKIGDWCQFGGHVAITGHVNIGNGVKVAGKSGVTNNVKDNETYFGSPALPANEYKRLFIAQKKLVSTLKEIKEMQKEIAALKKQIEGKHES